MTTPTFNSIAKSERHHIFVRGVFSLRKAKTMTLTTDQLYQIAITALGMLGVLVTAKAMQWRAIAKKIVIEAESARDDTTTQNAAVQVITDRYAKSDDLNMKLQRELRDCEVRDATKDGTIRDLQRMNHDLGERYDEQVKRNAIQAGLMLQLSTEHEAEKMAHEQTKKELQTVSKLLTAELARGRTVNGDGGKEPP